MTMNTLSARLILFFGIGLALSACDNRAINSEDSSGRAESPQTPVRERVLLDEGWRFMKYASPEEAGGLAFNGLALAIVRAKAGKEGEVKLGVSAEGLGDTLIDIVVER